MFSSQQSLKFCRISSDKSRDKVWNLNTRRNLKMYLIQWLSQKL